SRRARRPPVWRAYDRVPREGIPAAGFLRRDPQTGIVGRTLAGRKTHGRKEESREESRTEEGSAEEGRTEEGSAEEGRPQSRFLVAGAVRGLPGRERRLALAAEAPERQHHRRLVGGVRVQGEGARGRALGEGQRRRRRRRQLTLRTPRH